MRQFYSTCRTGVVLVWGLVILATLPGDLFDDASATSASLTTSIRQEFGARYVIAWLLVHEYEGSKKLFEKVNGELNDGA